MLALLSLAYVVLGQSALDSSNSQYVVEVLANETTAVVWNTSGAIPASFSSPYYSFSEIDLGFTFSYFFAPFRDVYVDSIGSIHFERKPPCCEDILCNFSIFNNSDGEDCDINSTYYNSLFVFPGQERTINFSYLLGSNALTLFFFDNETRYKMVLSADATMEVVFVEPPIFDPLDSLVGLRRAIQSGPSDSLDGFPTDIAGVYVSPDLLTGNNTRVVFCPITTMFCVSPYSVSRVGGDVIHVATGNTNTACFLKNNFSLDCLFINSDNETDFVTTTATVTSEGIECVTPPFPDWDAVDLRLAQTSTGKQLFHDPLSLLRLSPMVSPPVTTATTQCERCQSFLPSAKCPRDCSQVLMGNASLDDCLVCVSGHGTPNLDMNCRGMCFSPTPVAAENCLCNQSAVPDQNQQVVTPGHCWSGMAQAQPPLQDILRATDSVNAYRLAAVIACGLALLYWPLSLVYDKCKRQPLRSAASPPPPGGEAIPLA